MRAARAGELRRGRGFSLIELVVVLAIVVVLLSVLVPGIQRVRDATRRVQCQNNLRQIALGLHDYHDLFERFPPGYVSRNVAAADTASAETGPGYAWLAMTATMSLGASIDFDLGPGPAMNYGRPSAVICQAESVPAAFAVGDAPATFILPTASYVGVFGYGNMLESPGRPDWPGVFFRNSSTSIRDIRDGSSNTLMAGERRFRSPFSGAGADPEIPTESTWIAAIAGADRIVTVGGRTIREGSASYVLGSAGQEQPRVENVPNGPSAHPTGFSSAHIGGVNFLYGDGSIRFMDDGIEFDIFKHLCGREESSGAEKF